MRSWVLVTAAAVAGVALFAPCPFPIHANKDADHEACQADTQLPNTGDLSTPLSIKSTLPLTSGGQMPVFGLGTYRHSGKKLESALQHALALGYRAIDSADMYGNDDEIRRAVEQSGVPREELFVTSKLHPRDQGYESAKTALEGTLKRLNTEYLDLYLLHHPGGGAERRIGSWRALEEAYTQGKVRAIGLSNFEAEHIEELWNQAKVKPMVLQSEFHPYYLRTDLLELCRKYGMVFTSYGLLNAKDLLSEAVVQQAANAASLHAGRTVTPVQVLLRWSLQHGTVVIPKATSREHLEENMGIFDFELPSEDMRAIDALDEQDRYYWTGKGVE